jgi:hypothetical protein
MNTFRPLADATDAPGPWPQGIGIQPSRDHLDASTGTPSSAVRKTR